jgi:hypothetical protein
MPIARKSGRDDRPLGPRRWLLALFVFEFGEALEDERVRLIGQLGDQREVITTEAIGIVVLVSLVHIGPGEGDAVEFFCSPSFSQTAALMRPRRKVFTGRLGEAAAFLFSRGG